MKGHAIICHGLDSSPAATKAAALAARAEQLGWTHERPDFRDFDAQGKLGDVFGRIAHLRDRARQAKAPLVLAGSSMGAFISARVSLDVPTVGLFLMAPPIRLEDYEIALAAARVPTRIVHGWNDELIPAMEVVRWAQLRRDYLVLVDDSHRLAAHVDACAEEFARLLSSLA